MASSQFNRARIAGLATAVSAAESSFDQARERFGSEVVDRIQASTGVRARRQSRMLTTADLCYAAAEKLIESMSVDRSSVDAVIFVTQTPDYFVPASACVLQQRLGLEKSVAAFDVNQGCSGYVYGLWLASSLVESRAAKRVLLLVGDTGRNFASEEDRATTLLFGDAGTATVVEWSDEPRRSVFELGTDGRGAKNLIIPAGAARTPLTPERCQRTVDKDGNHRSDADLYMNGAEIFAFTLREIPKLVKRTLDADSEVESEDIDAFVFHQANHFMLKHLSKKMKVPFDRVPISLDDYGNTSSASIPITFTTRLREVVATEPESKFLLAGFGVGYSWAAATVRMDADTVLPELVEVDDSEAQPPLGLRSE